MLPVYHYLFLSFALLLIGAVGVLTRRNIIVKLFSIELIFNAAAINLAAFARTFADAGAQTFTLFMIAVIAAEIFVALAIIAAVFRRWQIPSPGSAEWPARPPAEQPEEQDVPAQ
jgi:NADH:ubiquinone oxidoreductase subunit K